MIKKAEISFVLIAICTYKRPNMLKNAINSIKELNVPSKFKIEILVVDNDSDKSAYNCINEIKINFPYKINYVVEEKRGLSNARNRVIDEAIKLNASHIFMFDDDEILTRNALSAHYNLYSAQGNCHISAGIVFNKFQNKTPKYIQNNIVFKKNTTKKTGQIRFSCASGNVFVPVYMFKENTDLRFSNEFRLMGGEDGEFFSRASSLGYTIIQNSDSVIYEDVTKERATVKYILRRSYYNGYSGSFLKFKENNKRKKLLWYIIKLIIVFLINIMFLIPSIILGLSVFFNVLAMCAKTWGKIKGAVNNSPMDFYQKTYGN